ncbi:MAG: NAD(P)-binding domain-containing protein, partial [Planctomycetota bacterium]
MKSPSESAIFRKVELPVGSDWWRIGQGGLSTRFRVGQCWNVANLTESIRESSRLSSVGFQLREGRIMTVSGITPGQTRIGWIGTGVMGASMCGHLISAGYSATVYSRPRLKSESLIARGAR